MEIHIIRHAHAVKGKDDAARPLSAKGRRQIRAMARFLNQNRLLAMKQIWHSPLVRARDTAQALAARLDGKVELVEVAELSPDCDPAVLARRLGRVRQPVAVVGHEPHLSSLATQLLTGRARPAVVVLKKCAVVSLQRSGRRWALSWLVSPDEI